MTIDIRCVADCCLDLIVSGSVRPRYRQEEQLVDDYRLELGGSAAIFASQCAKLGARVGLIGSVGRDGFGALLLERLAGSGIDCSELVDSDDLRTGLGVALLDGQARAILTYLGTIDGTPPARLEDRLLEGCRHWHVASYFLMRRLRSAWPAWLRRCRAAGLSTSLDTNWDPEEGWEGVHDLLPHVDVFLPNDAELRAISGDEDVERGARLLAARGPLVVVKCGADGAIACDGGRVHRAPAARVDRIVDAIGAGDSFDAGFLCAWLRRRPVAECLALGQRCAAASLAAAGGTAGQLQEALP